MTKISSICLSADNVKICADPHFFAYDNGARCCASNKCSGADITVASSCCDGGNSAQCDGGASTNCINAGDSHLL